MSWTLAPGASGICAQVFKGHTNVSVSTGKTPSMRRMSAALALCALCAACELAGAWADEKREIAPVVLFVRLPLSGEAPQGPPDGSAARPFPSLGAALAGAPDGALLRIGEGIYRETLLITRSVVLLGRGAGRTRIVAPDAATAGRWTRATS